MVSSSLRAGRVTLRPLEDGEVDQLAAILMRPGVREWWAHSTIPSTLARVLTTMAPRLRSKSTVRSSSARSSIARLGEQRNTD